MKALLTQPLLGAFVTNYAPRLAEEIAPRHGVVVDGLPFLSIITRTQGSRIQTLREVLMCLGGQSCQNFELLIVVHSTIGSAYEAVCALVGEFPAALRQRIRVITCTRTGRAAPLNDALRDIKGQYVAVLDDDDLVFGHWIETFQSLAREAPGVVLRATCTRQDFEMTQLNELPKRARATSGFQMVWPETYDAVVHLAYNQTPFMSLAFPAAVLHDLGLRFDESLSTTEDWDFANRIAMLCGVVDSAEVTSIYRWWTNAESSLFLHKQEEWIANQERIHRKLNSQPILLPPGSAARINMLIGQDDARASNRAQLTEQFGELERARSQLAERNEQLTEQVGELERARLQLAERNEQLTEQVGELERARSQLAERTEQLTEQFGDLERARSKLAERNEQLTEQVGEVERARSQLAERNEWMGRQLILAGIWLPWADTNGRLDELSRRILVDLVNSTSWRCSRPLRKIVNMLRGQLGSGVTLDEIPSSLEHSQRLIREVRTSFSWRVTRPLRVVGSIVRWLGVR